MIQRIKCKTLWLNFNSHGEALRKPFISIRSCHLLTFLRIYDLPWPWICFSVSYQKLLCGHSEFSFVSSKFFLGFPGSLKSSIPCFEEFLREIKDFYTDLTSISGTPLLHILPLIFFLFYIMIYIIFKRSRIRIRSAVQWRISSAICSLNLCWPTGYCQNSWPHFKTETKIWPRNASAT